MLGLLPEEYKDYSDGIRNLEFYIFKRKIKKTINKIWPGCYVQFAFQYDLGQPHIERGWVDVIDTKLGLVRIQCDDNMQGNRALTVRVVDIVEILPLKERYLVYYKTMVCGDCNKCNHENNDFPKECPNFNFFNALMNKQRSDRQFLEIYHRITTNGQNNDNNNSTTE